MPDGTLMEANEEILHGEDFDRNIDNLYKKNEDKKKNTYALKHTVDSVKQGSILDQDNVKSGKRGTAQPGQPHPGSKTGSFIASKQMVFGESKKLIPTYPTSYNSNAYNRESNMSQKYPNYSSGATAQAVVGDLQNQIVKHYQ